MAVVEWSASRYDDALKILTDSASLFKSAYERSNEWLSVSQSPDLLRRINAAASKVLARMQTELSIESSADALSNMQVDLDQELSVHAKLSKQAVYALILSLLRDVVSRSSMWFDFAVTGQFKQALRASR